MNVQTARNAFILVDNFKCPRLINIASPSLILHLIASIFVYPKCFKVPKNFLNITLIFRTFNNKYYLGITRITYHIKIYMLLLKNIFVILLLGFISSYVEGMRRCFRGQQNAQHGGHIVKLFL